MFKKRTVIKIQDNLSIVILIHSSSTSLYPLNVNISKVVMFGIVAKIDLIVSGLAKK